MSNHFHLLVEVPPKKKGEAVEIADEDFLTRLKPLYSTVYYRGIEQMLKKFRADGADKAAADLKEKFTCRMHDLSEFMKGLKQRFCPRSTHALRCPVPSSGNSELRYAA